MQISPPHKNLPPIQLTRNNYATENIDILRKILKRAENGCGEIAVKDFQLVIKPPAGLLSRLLRCCRPSRPRMEGGKYFKQDTPVSSQQACQLIKALLDKKATASKSGTNTSNCTPKAQPLPMPAGELSSREKTFITQFKSQPKDSSKKKFTNIEFCQTKLPGVDFSNSHFEKVLFDRTNCKETNFSNCHFKDTTFEISYFVGANFCGASFDNVKFQLNLNHIEPADWQDMLPILDAIDSVDTKCPGVRKDLVDQWFTHIKEIGHGKIDGLEAAVQNFPDTQGSDSIKGIITKGMEPYSVIKVADLLATRFTQETAAKKAEIIKNIKAHERTHNELFIYDNALHHLPTDMKFLRRGMPSNNDERHYFGRAFYPAQHLSMEACELSLKASQLSESDKKYLYNPPLPYPSGNFIIDNVGTVNIDATKIHDILITNSGMTLTGDNANCNNLAVKNPFNPAKNIILASDNSVFTNSEFSNAKIKGSAKNTTFKACKFDYIKMPDAFFDGATFEDTTFYECRLNGNLNNTTFKNVSLRGGNLSMARLDGASITLNLEAIKNGEDVFHTLNPVLTIGGDLLREQLVIDVRDRVKTLTQGGDPAVLKTIEQGFEKMLSRGAIPDGFSVVASDMSSYINRAINSINPN